jgi:protein TonB
MMNVSTQPSIKPSSIHSGCGNRHLLLMGNILLAHIALLALLMLVPVDDKDSQDAKPLPMMMVDLQPPVPLTVGQTGSHSSQPVTATNPSTTLTHEQPEGTTENNLQKQTDISHPNPQSQTEPPAAVNKLKPATVPSTHSPSSVRASQLESRANMPTTASEHAISTPQPGSNSEETSSQVSKRGSAVISASPMSSGSASSTSNGDSSSPKFGAGYLSNPTPEYPAIAREMGEEGKVLLRVLVTPEGLTKKVKLHRTSGSDSLDDAAVKAVRKWRFVPAKQGNQAIEAWVYVPIVFKLD